MDHNFLGTKIGSITSTTSSGLLSHSHVLCVSKLSLNLLCITINQLTASTFHVSFYSNGCVVRNQSSRKKIGTGRKAQELYFVERLCLPYPSLVVASAAIFANTLSIWHSRLGYVSVIHLNN